MIMKLVPQIICSCYPTMSIINCKKRAVWSYFILWKWFRLLHVNNNCDSIFILWSNQTNICVCCIAFNYLIRHFWACGWLDLHHKLFLPHFWAQVILCKLILFWNIGKIVEIIIQKFLCWELKVLTHYIFNLWNLEYL